MDKLKFALLASLLFLFLSNELWASCFGMGGQPPPPPPKKPVKVTGSLPGPSMPPGPQQPPQIPTGKQPEPPGPSGKPVPTPAAAPRPAAVPRPVPSAAPPARPTPAPGADSHGTLPLNWKEWWKRHEWIYTFRNRNGGVVTDEQGLSVIDSEKLDVLEKFLIRCLEDEWRNVRAGAALALGKLGRNTPAVRDGLLGSLRDRYPEVREASVLALGMIGAVSATGRVRTILENRRKHKGFRVYAAVSLGLLGDTANLGSLGSILRDEREKDVVRAGCILGIGLIGDERGAWELLPYLRGKGKESLQSLAVSAAVKIGLRKLKARSRGEKKDIDLVNLFEQRLANPATRTEVRRAMALGLGALGRESSSLEVLRRAYGRDRDEGVRGFALVALGRMKKNAMDVHEVGRFLCRAVQTEKNPGVQGFAVMAAALNGGPDAGSCLLDVFDSQAPRDVRASAALGLGLLGHQPALPYLGREVEDPRDSGEARGFSCISIGLIGGKKAAPYLRSILEEVDVDYLKWASARGLALMGDPSEIPGILAKTKEQNLVTRSSMVQAIRYFRDESTIHPLIDLFEREKSNQVRTLIVMTLGAIGEDSSGIPKLRRVDRDTNWKGAEKVHEIVHVMGLF